MKLADAKALIDYAIKRGVKRFRAGTFEVEFHAAAPPPPERRGAIDAAGPAEAGNPSEPAPTAAQQLDKINAFIYGNTPAPADFHEPN